MKTREGVLGGLIYTYEIGDIVKIDKYISKEDITGVMGLIDTVTNGINMGVVEKADAFGVLIDVKLNAKHTVRFSYADLKPTNLEELKKTTYLLESPVANGACDAHYISTKNSWLYTQILADFDKRTPKELSYDELEKLFKDGTNFWQKFGRIKVTASVNNKKPVEQFIHVLALSNGIFGSMNSHNPIYDYIISVDTHYIDFSFKHHYDKKLRAFILGDKTLQIYRKEN